MHSKSFALLGLFALTHALPSGVEKRQSFGIGGGSSEICSEATCQGKGDSEILIPPGFEIPPEFRADQPVKRTPQRGGGDDRRGGGNERGGRGGGRGGERGGWDDDNDRERERGGGKDSGKGKGGGSYPSPPRRPEEPKRPEPHRPEPHYPDEPRIPEVTKEDIIEKQIEYQILKDLIPTIRDPEQKRALQARLKTVRAFLQKHAGIVDIDAPPGVGTIFVPGRVKRSEDIFELLGVYTRLIVNIPRASPTAKKPSFPVYMLACQIADILVANGVKIDTSILDSWTEFTISNKVKRQDGIFRLPGTCTAEDIISLQTTLSAIQILYGRNPPFQIANLMNAVAAALQFCKVATPGVGKIIPEPTVPGAPLVPERPTPGAPLVPEKPVPGAPLVPEKPTPGAPLVPERPSGGGAVVPEKPAEGGAIIPEKPIETEFRPGKF